MMLAIVLTVTWQVISRFILSDPSSITEELARFLLIWIGILGAAYAYHTKSHLGFNLFLEKFSGTKKLGLSVFIECSVLTFAGAILIYGGLSLVLLTLELNQVSAALGIQMGWIYTVIPLSGGLIALYAVANIVELSAQLQQGDH
jgi:TRAP-type C4-dicarboxylate transport system permease small subunit